MLQNTQRSAPPQSDSTITLPQIDKVEKNMIEENNFKVTNDEQSDKFLLSNGNDRASSKSGSCKRDIHGSNDGDSKMSSLTEATDIICCNTHDTIDSAEALSANPKINDSNDDSGKFDNNDITGTLNESLKVKTKVGCYIDDDPIDTEPKLSEEDVANDFAILESMDVDCNFMFDEEEDIVCDIKNNVDGDDRDDRAACPGSKDIENNEDRIWNPLNLIQRTTHVMKNLVSNEMNQQNLEKSDKTAVDDQSAIDLQDREDIEKWNIQVNRDEIYSKYYKPSENEKTELTHLATSLNVKKNQLRGKGLGKVLGGVGPHEMEKITSILLPQQPVTTTLLKRGQVHTLESTKRGKQLGNDEITISDPSVTTFDRDFILLTNAFIIATASPSESSFRKIDPNMSIEISGNSGIEFPPKKRHLIPKLIKRSFEKSEFLSDVRAVIDLEICSPRSCRGLKNPECETTVHDKDGHDAQRELETDKKAITSADDYNSVDEDDGFVSFWKEDFVSKYGDTAFKIVCGGEQSYIFLCPSRQHKIAWLHALEKAVVGSRLRDIELTLSSRKYMGLGWRHDIIRTTIFSAGVCGDSDMVSRIVGKKRYSNDHNKCESTGPNTHTESHYMAMYGCKSYDSTDKAEMKQGEEYLISADCQPFDKDQINSTDSLGYGALHYAAMYGHATTLDALLEVGGIVNMKDGSQKTPMYYADQGGHQKCCEILKSNGGILEADEDRVELFSESQTNNVETKTKKWRWGKKDPKKALKKKGAEKDLRQKDAKKDFHSKAVLSKGTMAETMSAMHERGERLDDMANQTNNLMEAAENYKNMASLLAKKSKKKASWF